MRRMKLAQPFELTLLFLIRRARQFQFVHHRVAMRVAEGVDADDGEFAGVFEHFVVHGFVLNLAALVAGFHGTEHAAAALGVLALASVLLWLVNPFAASMLDTLTLDVAFIGCNGVHPVEGATNINLAEAEIKSRVRARSRRGILLADATKLGCTALAVIGGPGDFDTLVTAGIINGTVVDELRGAGMTVFVADRLTA